MRRVICLFILSFVFSVLSVRVSAQMDVGKYQLTMAFQSLHNRDNEMSNIDLKIYTEFGQSQTYILNAKTGYVGDNADIPFPTIYPILYSIAQRPNILNFYTYRDWDGWGDTHSEHRSSYTLDTYLPYINQVFTKANGNADIFGNINASILLKLNPLHIGIWYFNSQGVNVVNADTKYLPDTDKITLKATTGFSATTYVWKYSKDGGEHYLDFPATVSYSDNNSVVTFSGVDLDFSPDTYRDFITSRKSIMVKIDMPTSETLTANPQIITLIPALTAPHIQSISYTQETCNNNDDAVVYIKLDRGLIPYEVVAVKNGGTIIEASQASGIDANNVITLNNMQAGDYTFSIGGSYNTYNSYSQSPSHYKNFKIEARPKVVFQINSPKDISCYGGSDGVIPVTANGGTGSFMAKLYKDNDLINSIQEISLTTGQQIYFNRLEAGTYHIKVDDSNACTALIQTVTLTQPEHPVTVDIESKTKPLAFDSWDGEVTVRVDGGTRTSGNYTATLTYTTGQTFTPVSSSVDGTSLLYRFTGLHRGDYVLTVKDDNFSILATQDQNAPCGCLATLNFYLEAPPLLEIAIEETHFVNWYGANQGELTAHGKGGVPFTGVLPYHYAWTKLSGNGTSVFPDDSLARNLYAGEYQVKITDANGISSTSPIYTLDQPDSLSINFVINNVGCSGAKSGSIKALVTGGVEPYKYQWNIDGATSNEVSSVETGSYMFKVTDVRGGQKTAIAEVVSATAIVVQPTVTQPTCLVPTGKIELDISGGTPPYNIRWSDNQSGDPTRIGLQAGTYNVTVKDMIGCTVEFSFAIQAVHSFNVSLGDDITICRNQSRTIAALCAEPGVSYQWYYNDAPMPQPASEIIVDKEGIYRVRAVNPQGCFAEDQIEIKVSTEVLDMDLTVPTIVAVGSEIHAVNLSKAPADKIDWKLPPQAQIIKQSDTEIVFVIDQKGSYSFSMEGFKGDGASIITRTIQIVDKGDVILPDDNEPLIKQFLVTPNPSTGYFKIYVELNRAEDFTMMLYSTSGVLMDKKESSAAASKTFEYEVNGSLQGIYTLQLITKTDKSVQQIEIKR